MNTLNEIVNKYREKKLAHAYLIETNDIKRAFNDIKKITKVINCPNDYKESCNTCPLCNLINKNNLPSLITIEPDGNNIKKDQIEELKRQFNTMPIYSKYNTYIMLNAEKLNASSANRMLKFLEEPTEGIIGFFITSNKDVMLDTIKSRCQTIILNYPIDDLLSTLGLPDEELNKYKTLINNYLHKISSKEPIINKNEILSTLKERKEITTLFVLIFNIYYNHYLKSINAKYDFNLVSIYDVEIKNITQKLAVLKDILLDLNYNTSLELLLDKFVIEMRKVHG